MNLSRLDLVSMRLVVECAMHGSISAAAARCHLSVMGASERLRRLEETVGKPLFHRHRKGLQITQAGCVAVRWAEVMLEGARHLVREVAAVPPCLPKQALNPGRRGRQPHA